MSHLNNVMKIVLSILFLLCLLKMPYGYYQLVRFIGMLGFLLLCYFSYQNREFISVIIYTSLALLFQPFIKVALGRTNWNIVDVLVSIGLVLSIFYKPKLIKK